jgi:uncharacterized protein (DUF1800 family)
MYDLVSWFRTRVTLAVFTLLVLASVARAESPRLFNISTRGPVGTGGNIMISGLVVGAGSPDTVLIRAVGPTLQTFNVDGWLQNPTLSIFDSAGNLIYFNQGWQTASGSELATPAVTASAGAFALQQPEDCALVVTLPTGSYTAEVAGYNQTTGVALLEIYEIGATSTTARLINLSTRGSVGTGANLMIPGFTLSGGTGNRTLLVRAVGPGLAAFGVTNFVPDPAFTLENTAQAALASNDNWGTPVGDVADATVLTSDFSTAGAFALQPGSLDAAVETSLGTGGYTVLVTGNGGGTGVALVEVYDITPPPPVNTPTPTPTPTPPPSQGQGSTVTLVATNAAADTSGNNPGSITVTRSGDTSQALVVNYSVGGTAVNGIDYTGLAGTVTIPAGSSSVPITVAPNPTLSTNPSSTVVLTLATGTGYQAGSAATATVTITNIPPTLFVAEIRPTSNAPETTGSGTATVLLSADGSLASVSLSFANLSSGEVVAHLAVGGDTNNGTYVLNLPSGQVSGLTWTPTATGSYSAAQIVAALNSGNLFVEIDSASFPSGELGGQFIAGTGSQTFSAPPAPPALNLSVVSNADAPRFLTQATFGPRVADITTLQSQGYAAWITNQIALPATSHRTATDADFAAFPATGQTAASQNNRQAAWWSIAINAPDQLRQRVAFALSEIFVISDVASQLSGQADGVADYNDLLVNDAFGNFRTLLQDVTLSPAMGNYLNMLRNAKANPAKGTSADENYAREVQQLFTIGLNELQPDGTLKLDADGQPIPTYNQDEIVQTANVFTGWGYNSTAASPSFYGAAADFDDPMMAYASYHDETAKTVVNGVVIPAAQTAAADLKMELDALFNHPNVGPFICAQLIQRLVTSNPSPAYVYRVAQVFANDGTGTRGNLAAVVRAILLDYEARDLAVASDAGYGKLKEPLLRMTGIYRAFNAAAGNGRYAIFNPQTPLAEAALRSPTVFNFFDPGYVQQGPLASAGLLAPEFQITTASTEISVPNYIYSSIYYGMPPAATTVALDLSSLTANSTTPSAMVATLNQLLCAGAMSSATQTQIASALAAVPASTTATALAQMALYLAATSPDAATQR